MSDHWVPRDGYDAATAKEHAVAFREANVFRFTRNGTVLHEWHGKLLEVERGVFQFEVPAPIVGADKFEALGRFGTGAVPMVSVSLLGTDMPAWYRVTINTTEW